MFARNIRSTSTSIFQLATRGYKKTIEQLANEKKGILNNARVLVRVDFNVPQDKANPAIITDDTRIREALPTIKFLVDNGAKVLLASHCGRPKKRPEDKFRMAPMAKRLGELLNKPVATISDSIGPVRDEAVSKLKGGDILMLENVRFYPDEEKNVPAYAEKLAKDVDVYVNDAFGTAHRAHASTAGVAKFVNHKVAGYLMQKEIQFLKGAIDAPKRPFAAIVGGAKVSTKITVIKSLMDKCDKIFIGGGMIFTFYRAQGLSIGKSLVEEEFIPLAKELIDLAKQKGVKLFLPSDVMIASEFKNDAEHRAVSVNNIPDGWIGVDIGPESIKTFRQEITACQQVVWNGPMGVFEMDNFAKGTLEIAHALADVTAKGGVTVIGGGDSVAAVNKAKLNDKMSHISTGGGASLEMLEGLELPGVAALDDAK